MLVNCASCGAEFEPIKPKSGPTSSRCLACYPLEARRRNVEKVTACVRRARGEQVPNVRTCRHCGQTFDRLWGKSFCSAACRVAHRTPNWGAAR